MAERDEDKTHKTILNKLEDVERRMQSLETKSPQQGNTNVFIQGNIGFLGSVGGENNENVQNTKLESKVNTQDITIKLALQKHPFSLQLSGNSKLS